MPDAATYMNDTLVGALVVTFAILVPMKMKMPGPEVPLGWSSDIESIIEYLQRLSQLVIDFPKVQETDINMLLVFKQGNGCKVVGERMVIS